MRHFYIFIIVIVLAIWAVIQFTILANRSSFSSTSSSSSSNSHTQLDQLLIEATKVITQLQQRNHSNNNKENDVSASNNNNNINNNKEIEIYQQQIHKLTKYSENMIHECEKEKKRIIDECASKNLVEQQQQNSQQQQQQLHLHTKHRRKVWLAIGIPTIGRKNQEDYLLQCLSSLADQLPSDPSDLLYGNVLIIVVNLQSNPLEHIRYQEAKKLYTNLNHPKSIYFEFHDDAGPDHYNPFPGRQDHGTPNHPGYLVRKQTRDLVKVIQLSQNKSFYYLFLEDDMLLCSSGFITLSYVINKSSRYHPNWLAIRLSYGMNGIIMNSHDIQTFSQYLLTHQSRRPPDHLVVEWYAGETIESHKYKQNRVNIGFRYNLFHHLGKISTLRSVESPKYLTCYEELLEPTVFAVEAFNVKQCPQDDIWPCNVDKKLITKRLDFHLLQ